jgi:predicted nucleotidyltransferase component of viral defense system
MSTIEEIIKNYNPETINDNKAILREIVQSIVLVGLSRTDFFKKASFYGGTALRIFYDLNRYSEDLDFTLNNVDKNFLIAPFIESIKNVALSYGLELEISIKQKQISTPVESAFAKINTYQTFINLKMNSELTKLLHKDEVIKVKFEIDCEPALGFTTENKWIDMPEFAPVIVLDEASLFAGKLHAILCRNYKNTVKGRDYYDFLFYVRRGISPNLNYLRNKLINTGKINEKDTFNIDVLKEMLIKRFEQVDFEQVKNDTERFIINNEDLSTYSKDLFVQMVKKIK